MKVIETGLEGCYVIEPRVFEDERGYFVETYNEKNYKENGIDAVFVQDNQSFTKQAGIIRGMHLQLEPMAQTKLVRCTQGAVYDVAVDLRKDSPTYLKWFGIELSAENHKQLFIPRGFAHGFQALTDNVIFQYKVDNYYSKAHEIGFSFSDPDVNIDWPLKVTIQSEKDMNAPKIKETVLWR